MIRSSRNVFVVTLGVFALTCLSAVAAEEVIDNAIRQLGRGCTNVLTGALEIPANILQVKEDEGDLAALTYGTLRGTYRFLVREVVGVFEVVTFPAGFKPIVEPEFGGAPRVISETYEPDMRNSVSASGEWKLNRIERYSTK